MSNGNTIDFGPVKVTVQIDKKTLVQLSAMLVIVALVIILGNIAANKFLK